MLHVILKDQRNLTCSLSCPVQVRVGKGLVRLSNDVGTFGTVAEWYAPLE